MKLDTIPSVSVTHKNTETFEYRLSARNTIALFKRHGTELPKHETLEKHFQNGVLQKQCTFHYEILLCQDTKPIPLTKPITNILTTPFS